MHSSALQVHHIQLDELLSSYLQINRFQFDASWHDGMQRFVLQVSPSAGLLRGHTVSTSHS